MSPPLHWIIAALIALILGSAGALLDGPSEHDTAQAVADDIAAAQADANRLQRDPRARWCRATYGATAIILETPQGHLVCRHTPGAAT